MATPRILTFNFHEPYLCMMAATGLPFDIGLYEKGNFARIWQQAFRPAPPNLSFVGEQEWRSRVKAGYYDVVIAQNETNAIDAADGDAARLLICHNRRTFLNTTIQGDSEAGIANYNQLLEDLQHFYDFVFISESKRADYGIPGRVILPGIDVDAWGGYRGENAAIIRVGNTMRERDRMFDVDFQEACCAGLSNQVIGTNPQIPGSKASTSFDDLLEQFRSNRCLLHVSREAYEDGYNLAMLEAMACGMPVVSLANPTSPITHGEDGFSAYNSAELHGHLRRLLEDPNLAREVGARGRDTVAEKFPLSRFVTQWREAILEAADTHTKTHTGTGTAPTQRVGVPVLMSYIASPHTTGGYIREALCREHAVVSCGAEISNEILLRWGFKAPVPDYHHHEIALPEIQDTNQLRGQLPKNFNPALLLWVDSGQAEMERPLAPLDIPKAAWFIDTHVTTAHRIEIARHFDYVYLAQRAQIAEFEAAGISHVRWMPLGCAPELHAVERGAPRYDVAFVGSVASASGDNRRRFIERIKAEFPNHFIAQCWPHEMAEAYAHAKIVVNMCLNQDVNMRVFEAMASGALLVTDKADGLDELFTVGEDLVVYADEEEAVALITHYLADDGARKAIAQSGQEHVLRAHRYDDRIQAILSDIETQTGPLAVPLRHHDLKSDEEYYQHPRRELLQAIPLSARRILDVGCGAGALGKVLKEERGAEEVCGIEFMEEAYSRAINVLDRVYLGNIETMALPFEDLYFDCIICADVLEHLVEPEAVLRKLDRVLAPHGVVVISIPNARNYEVIRMLGSGAWTYFEEGIMDATHLRFFTRTDFVKMIEAGGMKAAEVQPLNARPPSMLPKNEDGSLTVGNITYKKISDADYADLLGYQLLGIACKANWDCLQTANRAMEAGEYETALALALEGIGVDEIEQLHVIARAYGRMGNLQKAEAAYKLLLEKTDMPLIVGDYGILLVAMNDMALATPLLKKAFAADPTLDRVDGALGLVALRNGNAAEAYEHIHRAMLSNFEHKGLLLSLIDVARALKRLEDALPVITAYIEFYPGNLELKASYAEVLRDLGRIEEAREQLDMILLFEPDHEIATQLLASLEATDSSGNP